MFSSISKDVILLIALVLVYCVVDTVAAVVRTTRTMAGSPSIVPLQYLPAPEPRSDADAIGHSASEIIGDVLRAASVEVREVHLDTVSFQECYVMEAAFVVNGTRQFKVNLSPQCPDQELDGGSGSFVWTQDPRPTQIVSRADAVRFFPTDAGGVVALFTDMAVSGPLKVELADTSQALSLFLPQPVGLQQGSKRTVDLADESVHVEISGLGQIELKSAVFFRSSDDGRTFVVDGLRTDMRAIGIRNQTALHSADGHRLRVARGDQPRSLQLRSASPADVDEAADVAHGASHVLDLVPDIPVALFGGDVVETLELAPGAKLTAVTTVAGRATSMDGTTYFVRASKDALGNVMPLSVNLAPLSLAGMPAALLNEFNVTVAPRPANVTGEATMVHIPRRQNA